MALAGLLIWQKNKAVAPSSQKIEENNPVDQNPDVPEAPKPNVIYPMSSFKDREIVNPFGRYFAPGTSSHPDLDVCSNAVAYTGYHTALDIEALPDETSKSVPILSIASGIVRRATTASGYGGLVVIQYALNGQTYTAYYGHLNINSINLKENAKVNLGDKIGELGPACSSANGVTRKHLHFGLHKGTEIDIRGYVPSQNVLNNWADPASLLKTLVI